MFNFDSINMFTVSIIFVIINLYIMVKRHYSKWKRLGIPSDEHPSLFYGSLNKVRSQELPMGLALAEIYHRFQDKFVGIYLLFKPAILVRDAEMVRHIMTTAFESFHDRGIYEDEKYNPMSAHLFSLRGQKWRSLRAKLTPSFSSGKLKGMFETVDDVGQKLIEHISDQLKDGQLQELEVKNLITTYAVDIVGSSIFGLDIDSFANPDNEFRRLTNRIFNESSILQNVFAFMSFTCPPVAVILGRLGVRDPVTYRLREIAKQTIEHREKNKVIRKDLLQLLVQLRNTGKISDDPDQLWSSDSTTDYLKSISIDVIAANLFIFYMAGSETTAATISYTIYELAMNPEILQKVQADVNQCLEKHGLGTTRRLTYEAVQDMTYLELCVMETLRKYPAALFLNRECTHDYPVPGTEFVIEKGTAIIVPLIALHRDPEYFPDPMDYKPERFMKEQMDYNPKAYYPFGQGPRQCIAERMGMVNVKAAVAKILANFNIHPKPRKEVEFKFSSTPLLLPKDGLHVTFSKRNK